MKRNPFVLGVTPRISVGNVVLGVVLALLLLNAIFGTGGA